MTPAEAIRRCATVAFLGTLAALALGWHLRLFGCHRREENDQPPASWITKQRGDR